MNQMPDFLAGINGGSGLSGGVLGGLEAFAVLE